MFGFGKRKIASDDFGMMFISEAFNSINGLSLFFAHNIDGFFSGDTVPKVNGFLNDNGFGERDRLAFTCAYAEVLSKMLLEWSRNSNAMTVYLSATFQISDAIKNNNINLDVSALNKNVENILRNNQLFSNDRLFFKGSDHFDEMGVYSQLSKYLYDMHISKNEMIHKICSENFQDYQTALFNCFNRAVKSVDSMFANYKVAT